MNLAQNLAFAFIHNDNALGAPLVAGVLFLFTGWLLSPLIAALATSLSSASVISNALRLRRAALEPSRTDRRIPPQSQNGATDDEQDPDLDAGEACRSEAPPTSNGQCRRGALSG